MNLFRMTDFSVGDKFMSVYAQAFFSGFHFDKTKNYLFLFYLIEYANCCLNRLISDFQNYHWKLSAFFPLHVFPFSFYLQTDRNA